MKVKDLDYKYNDVDLISAKGVEKMLSEFVPVRINFTGSSYAVRPLNDFYLDPNSEWGGLLEKAKELGFYDKMYWGQIDSFMGKLRDDHEDYFPFVKGIDYDTEFFRKEFQKTAKECISKNYNTKKIAEFYNLDACIFDFFGEFKCKEDFLNMESEKLLNFLMYLGGSETTSDLSKYIVRASNVYN